MWCTGIWVGNVRMESTWSESSIGRCMECNERVMFELGSVDMYALCFQCLWRHSSKNSGLM